MAMKTINYKVDSDLVKTEGPNRYSRDEIVLPSGFGPYEVGTPVAVSGGAFVPFDPAGEDGAATPVHLLLEQGDASAASRRVVVLSRHAEIVRQAVAWPDGTTAAQQSTALAVLETQGIVARMGV